MSLAFVSYFHYQSLHTYVGAFGGMAQVMWMLSVTWFSSLIADPRYTFSKSGKICSLISMFILEIIFMIIALYSNFEPNQDEMTIMVIIQFLGNFMLDLFLCFLGIDLYLGNYNFEIIQSTGSRSDNYEIN